MFVFPWFRKTSFKWTGLKLGSYFFIYTQVIIPKSSSMPMYRAPLTCSSSSCAVNSQQKNLYCNFTEKKHAVLIKTVLQFCGSIYFNACYPHDSANVQSYYRNSKAQRNPLTDVTSLRLAQRESISLKDKQGILVPRTIPAFIIQESSTSEWIPQIPGIYQMP